MTDLARWVVDWQSQQGRQGMPWQGQRDPYRVWLSEIMLQQTQVSTVLDYYPRFLSRFPDVAALASASLDEVYALWSGLGYYSRARNLHRCAQDVMSKWGGSFPADAQSLQSLPGIGRSTAAAIAAFCHGERAAILDGNVKRVLARVWAFGDDLAKASAERDLLSRAQAVLPESAQMPRYTQGLMDLGATICTPRKPDCERCPLSSICVARREARQLDYPKKTRKLKRSTLTLSWALIEQDGHVLLQRRPSPGIWAGLWSLPQADSVLDWRERASQENWPGRETLWPEFIHVLTHRDMHISTWHWKIEPGHPVSGLTRLCDETPGLVWVAAEDVSTLGMPAPLSQRLPAWLSGQGPGP